jgi:hypothetical protein
MGSYKFRVLLDSEKDEEIFRDIQISDSSNFEELYRAILSSFHFEGKEIGSFFMSNDSWDKGHEISLMDMRYGDDDPDMPSVMSEAVLKEHMEEKDQKIILVYDFLRMWIFLIELLETSEEEIVAPKVALSIGMAPPEDSKMVQDDAFFGSEEDDDFDEFGDEFDEGYDDEDFGSGYEEYEY